MANNETIEQLAVSAYEKRKETVNGEGILRHIMNIFNLSNEVWRVYLKYSIETKKLNVEISFDEEGSHFFDCNDQIKVTEEMMIEMRAIDDIKIKVKTLQYIKDYISQSKDISDRYYCTFIQKSLVIGMKKIN